MCCVRLHCGNRKTCAIYLTEPSGKRIIMAQSINPAFRYRGYYYDTETGFYYLQSRYYDPSVGRFVNADGQFETTLNVGLNLFAYCGNDPVNRADPSGECYYNAQGQWCHDNWEYSGGYVRQPAPVDITDKLNTAMRINAATLNKYKSNENYIKTVVYFIDKVKPGGEWDFKSQDEWALDSNTTYVYNGTELRYDDIGNIHYGYVGRVIFNSKILLVAGGVVQIYAHTSDWSYWRTNFDDPRDQWAIQFGSAIWDAEALS